MRIASLFTSVVLVLALLLGSAGQARAQITNPSGPGYTCAPNDKGETVCTGTNNGSGYTCTTKATGEMVCVGNGSTGGGTGGGSTGGGSTGGSTGGSSGPGWLSKMTGWFSGALSNFFASIVAFFKDLLVGMFSALLALFSAIVDAIPVPDFIKTYSMGAILSHAGPDLGYFLNILKIGEGFAIIGAAYAFRLLRKLLTLFQW